MPCRTIGGERLLETYGSPMAVAEALLLGKLGSFEQEFVWDACGKTILEAAKIRIELTKKCPKCGGAV
jgi:hypothetical protein